jgi:hypothetical protein
MPEMPALLGGLFVNPPILWLILFCVDRYNADRDWTKLFLVPLCICGVTGILSLCMTLYIPALPDILIVAPIVKVTGILTLSAWISLHIPTLPAVLIVAPIVSVFALHRFFDMSWVRATVSAILFTIWLIAWPIIGMFLLMKLAA